MSADGNPRPSEDAALAVERRAVARAQAGERWALEPVLAAHAGALYAAVILPRVGERAAAEDILRDTFVTAIEKIDGFRFQDRSLFFWLRRIALNKIVDAYRRRGRCERLLEELRGEAQAAELDSNADDALIAEQDRRAARARIESAIASLPPRQAQAIRLRLVEERERQECAAAMGVTVGNFDVILFRAVRAFRAAHGER